MTIVNPITPLEAFYKRVESTPNKVYLRQPRGARWQEFTWVETQDIVRKLAQKLKDLGINPGDRVAILAKNSAFWFMSDLAIMMVGAVSVPLYPTQTDESMTYVLNHSEAKAIFLGKLDRPMASGVMSDEIIKINMPGSKYESADQQASYTRRSYTQRRNNRSKG
ncbi:MAG: AMP-binding protein, partial [Pseudobacteriovorax sp.]|nr:AMP-binding protein [Pseudobacteriovorax sp.]